MSKATASIVFLLAILSSSKIYGKILPESDSISPQFRLASEFLNTYSEMVKRPMTESLADSIRRIKEDGFIYSEGNDLSFSMLKGDEDYFINFGNGKYEVGWSRDDKNIVVCSFPANIFLLKMSDKQTLETSLFEALETEISDYSGCEIPTVDSAKLQPVEYSDFFVNPSVFFITPQINDKIVYTVNQESPDSCLLLYDFKNYPYETLDNFILTGYSESPIDVHLISKGFNGQSAKSITVPYQLLNAYLQNEGCRAYWGRDSADDQYIKGLSIWENVAGGYLHVLSITIPTEALHNFKEAKIEAVLHSYIRTDNLKQLFEELNDL